ncbi:MAG: ribulose-phosphate 3-epimerase [Planctomycetota bacterium]
MSTGRDRFFQLCDTTPTVLPSMLLCDFGNLEREIQRLEEAGVAGLHLDVMDGVFVPNFTYGMTIVSAVRKLTEMAIDVHLMMVNPEKYIDQFCEAGADVLTIHAEATEDPASALTAIRKHDVAAGIAVNPDTPVTSIESAIAAADLALVMSVHAGFGGQSFMDSVLPKFDAIRSALGGENVVLEIDGGINVSTIQAATSAGAQLLVAGSAIFKQDDYSIALEQLMGQIQVA